MQNEEEIKAHYLRIVTETARERVKKVMESNGLPSNPTDGSMIRPVPVYEEGGLNLLQLSQRIPTEIVFPMCSSDQYVSAYVKRYRNSDTNRLNNRVVITTENYCWARFLAAKELTHCSMDEDGISATANFRDFETLVEELADPSALALATSAQTIVDQYAWLGAVFYVVPDGWVPLLRQLRKELCQQAPEKARDAELYLAHLLRVPVSILRHRINGRGVSAA